MSEPTTDQGRRPRRRTGTSRKPTEQRHNKHREVSEPNAETAITTTHNSAQPRRAELNAQHLAAIDLVLAGKPDGEVAAALGIRRETINRWRRWNPLFRAELNSRRIERHRAVHARLDGLYGRAVDVLEDALATGDVKVALTLLKRLDERPAPGGAVEPEDAVREMVRAEQLQVLIDNLGDERGHPLYELLRRLWLEGRDPEMPAALVTAGEAFID